MRSFWLAIRIAVIFTILLIIVLVSTFHLFGRVAGPDLTRALGKAKATEIVPLAVELERLLLEQDLSSPELHRLLQERARSIRMTLALLRPDGSTEFATRHRRKNFGRRPPPTEATVQGRSIKLFGPPSYDVEIPLSREGVVVGKLVVGPRLHSPNFHRTFGAGLLRIGVVVLLAVVGLALYLTRPLRLTCSSMDRIAEGDLSHRVPVRGYGEVARMGRVFNSMADRVEQMVMGQKELLAGVSHELRSPLARMKVGLELLRDEGAMPDRLEALENDVDAIDDMVEELLTASRLELGESPLKLSCISLDELATRAWDRVQAAAEERGIRLQRAISEDAATVLADEAVARQLLGNLFENSVRYAARGAVTISAHRRGKRVEVMVADEGKGVEPGVLERLFEPFYRADPSRSRKTGATGLGLMIARRAVEAHGGRIFARQAQTGGLEVVFDLPTTEESSGAAAP